MHRRERGRAHDRVGPCIQESVPGPALPRPLSCAHQLACFVLLSCAHARARSTAHSFRATSYLLRPRVLRQARKLIERFRKGDVSDRNVLSWEGFSAYFNSELTNAFDLSHLKVYQVRPRSQAVAVEETKRKIRDRTIRPEHFLGPCSSSLMYVSPLRLGGPCALRTSSGHVAPAGALLHQLVAQHVLDGRPAARQVVDGGVRAGALAGLPLRRAGLLGWAERAADYLPRSYAHLQDHLPGNSSDERVPRERALSLGADSRPRMPCVPRVPACLVCPTCPPASCPPRTRVPRVPHVPACLVSPACPRASCPPRARVPRVSGCDARPLQDVITAIKVNAFKTSPYPIILSLEVHCSVPQQQRMAQILAETLGTMVRRSRGIGCRED